MNAFRAAAILMTMTLFLSCRSSSPQEPAASPAPVASAPASQPMIRTRVSMGDPFTPRTDEASLNAFVPDVAPVDSGGECSVYRTGGSGATIVTAYFPKRAGAHTSTSITFDSAGHLIRFSERRGAMPIPTTADMTDAQRDSVMRAATAARRSTSISFDYAIDQAVVSNSGGGRPTNAILGTVRAIEKLEKLGPPTARLARVRKFCGV